jgi:hypothetical protein
MRLRCGIHAAIRVRTVRRQRPACKREDSMRTCRIAAQTKIAREAAPRLFASRQGARATITMRAESQWRANAAANVSAGARETIEMSEQVAVLGLGTMGLGMAGRLFVADFPLVVWNRTAIRAGTLEADGVRVGKTPADAARGATCVLSMLSDDNASPRMAHSRLSRRARCSSNPAPFRLCGCANSAPRRKRMLAHSSTLP